MGVTDVTPREECLEAMKHLSHRKPGYWWAEQIVARKKKGFSMPSIAVQMAEEVLGYGKDETEL
jgi:hypothetical protein